MSSESPVVELYSSDGYELSAQNNVALPLGTRGLISAGYDGTTVRFILIDGSARQVMVGAGTAGTPAGGVVSIQGVAGGTAVPVSGTVTANNASVSTTGTTPPGSATYIGGSVTTAAPTYTTGQMNALSLTTAGALRIDGSAVTQPVSGTVTANAGTGNFAVVQATAANLNATVVASGNFNNASVSATAAAPPGSATYIGGSVTTAAPTYTTGQMDPLSLTTAGALRIDGSAVTQPVSGTVTANAGTGNFTVVQATAANLNATVVQGTAANLRTQTASEAATAATTPTVAGLAGGAVTTAAPTYTTGQMDPLSLTTTGLLRVDGSGVTQPVSGTVTANAGTGNFNVIGTGTAGTAATGVVTIQGIAGGVAVPISGTVTAANASVSTTNTTPPGSATYIGGSVTTAAPTYTTATMNALSLTTAGALRIDGSAVTQPVSGTVTANAGTGTFTVAGTVTSNQGTANTLANAWSTKITDATNGPVAVKAASTAAVAADPSLVTAFSPNSPLPTGTNSIGTVNQGTAASLANAWSMKITDATNGPAAVKPASTAAVATDPALVVAISPNNALSIATADTTGTGTLNALNATAAVVLSGHNTVGMQLLAGTLIGTIVPEISLDGGTTWVATFFDDPATSNKSSSIVFGTANTATTRTIIGAGGASNARVRVSAFTSGTATCNLRATQVTDPTELFGGAAGSALPPVVAQVGGSVTTAAPTYTTATINALSLTTGGLLRIDGSGVTQPVSGTVTANAGTGTFTVGGTVTANQGTANTLANAWSTKITDATNGPAAVKAASTAVVATDPALVVAISPNSNTVVTTGTADVTAAGALGALNATVQLTLAGHATSGFQLAAGTLIGTIVAETSFDGGTTWNATYIDQLAGNKVSSIVFAVANTATASTMVGVGGTGLVRVRVSAYTSGTANITLRASVVADPSTLTGGNPNSTVQPPDSTQIAGWDGTTLRVPSVKAASTSAVAADQALVVAISPNTVVNPDTVATGALGALNASVSVNVSGLQTVGVQIATGTLAGTILPEFSWDGGTTYSPGYFIGPASLGPVATLVFTNPNPAQGKMIAIFGGVGLVRVRVSAYTSGTCNITLRASEAIPEFVGLAGAQTGAVAPPMVLQVGGSDGTNLHALSTTTTGVLNVNEADQLSNNSYPAPLNAIVGTSNPTIDAFGNLEIRGPVLTDEGALRDDFTGTALTTALTGTVNFTNASTAVTGTGTAFTTQVAVGQYIKKTADPEADYAQVGSVQSDTALTLNSNYLGTTAGAASVVSNWQTVTPATGGSFAVATSVVTLACGTAANGTGSLRSLGDYLPYSVAFYAEVSQRIANQTIYMGVQDVVGTPAQQATVQFTGTVNTTVNFVTSYANTTADTQTTAATIPNGGTTATYHQYRIDLSPNQATLSIDGIVVAVNTTHLPAPYTSLFVTAGVVNGAVAPASNTNLLIDYIFFENIDRVQIDDDFSGEPLSVLTQQSYGVNNQTITITLNSLTNTSQRQSTAVNNTATVFRDALVQIVVQTAAAGVSATGIVNIYAYASSNGGTTYGDTATGTDGAVTLTSPPNLKLIGTMNTVANATAYDSNPMSVAAVFGGKLPQFWGIVVENKSGATFNATAGNFKAFYQGVTG